MASGTLLATQVALVAKNSPANARDQRCRSIPGSGRSPGGGNGKPFQYSCLKISWMEKPDGLQSVGSQIVGHNWSDLARMHFLKTLNLVWFYFFVFHFGIFFFLLVVKLCACYWNIKNIVSVRCGGRFPLFLHSLCACPFACGLFHSSVHSFSARSRHSPPCLSIRTWSSNSLLYVNYISRKWEDLFKKERKLAKHLQQLVFHWISAMYGALF